MRLWSHGSYCSRATESPYSRPDERGWVGGGVTVAYAWKLFILRFEKINIVQRNNSPQRILRYLTYKGVLYSHENVRRCMHHYFILAAYFGHGNWSHRTQCLTRDNAACVFVVTVGELRFTPCTKTPLFVRIGSYIKQIPMGHLPYIKKIPMEHLSYMYIKETSYKVQRSSPRVIVLISH